MGMLIFFSVISGFFISEAVRSGEPQLAFGALAIYVTAMALRAEGRMQMAKELQKMSKRLQDEEDLSHSRKEDRKEK